MSSNSYELKKQNCLPHGNLMNSDPRQMVSTSTLCVLLAVMVVLLFIASLAIGREPLPLLSTVSNMLQGDGGAHAIILSQIRLPRALIAVFAGASLGLCGAAMQGLLRNPLASPGLIGSSSGAALFAVFTLYVGTAYLSPLVLPLAGMTGALLATALVYVLAGRNASVTTLILAGVAVNAIATAGMSLLLNLAPSPYAVRELVLWTMGDITDRSMNDFWLMLPTTLLGWALLMGVGGKLDALTLGERTALSMGVNPVTLRWRVFIAVSLAVGAAVSTTGMIGFVGLVVPHLLRPLVGHEPGKVLFTSAIGGAALLLAADVGVRILPTDPPLKVGVLTAMVGAPFFLYLIIRSRRQYL
jgi:iron complex transport system permease protein